jgi:hypothetical protein
VAEAAAALDLARRDRARIEAALAACLETRSSAPGATVPALLLEIEAADGQRRRAETARLVADRTAALALEERCRDALARAVRARSALG